MTEPPAGSSRSSASPLDLDTLADFHAGVLDAATTADVEARLATDPGARAVLAALDATVADLASLPPVELPAPYARRLDSALAAEAGHSPVHQLTPPPAEQQPRYAVPPPPGPGAQVTSLDAARQKRLKRTRLLAVAAAAVIVVGGGTYAATQLGGGNDTNVAGPSAPAQSEVPGAPEYDNRSITDAGPKVLAAGKLTGGGPVDVSVAGEMAEPSARATCLIRLNTGLRNAGTQQVASPSAVQQIVYEGTPSYVFLFPLSDETQVRLIVVPTDSCGTVTRDVVVPVS